VRVRAVLAVLYLIYNAGTDNLDDGTALRSEAIRLARALVSLMPDEPEAAGLVALLLLNESRVPARRGGVAVLLRDQDRTRWDRAMIEAGHTIVRECISGGRPGPYQLQAAIQAVHCDATTYESTDWHQIVALYDHLAALMPTPVVALNRAIAVGETAGPATALGLLDRIEPELDDYGPLHAARAAMLRRLGRASEAVDAYGRAAALATSDADRRYLRSQIGELTGRADR